MKKPDAKQEKRTPDDFDAFGLCSPRLRTKRMRDLLTDLREINAAAPKEKLDLTRPSSLDDEYFRPLFSIQANLSPLFTDVTPILRMRAVPRRARMALFYCHFLPYLVLALFPLILAVRLLNAL